jgi:hypothetical protein
MTRKFLIRLAIAVLVLSLIPCPVLPATVDSKHLSVLKVYTDSNDKKNVKIVTAADDPSQHWRMFTLPHEPGQVGIDSVKISDDGFTAGWLVLYEDPDAGTPVAGKLILWRDGRVVRSFTTGQAFWSWALEGGRGQQVAFHVGPTHGEPTSRCELHDVRTGFLRALWQGDLENPDRPTWTRDLDH